MNYSRRGHPVLPVQHDYARTRLYVTRIPGSEILLDGVDSRGTYYVKCNKFGLVDWDDPEVLVSVDDLVIRDNVFLIARQVA